MANGPASSGIVDLKSHRKKRGRPFGSRNRVQEAIRPGARRNNVDLISLADNSGPARFFRKMCREIEVDLGGRRFLSRIESELIRAFAGAATQLQYQNVQIALGEAGEIDPTAYSTMASTMLRIGSRLGLSRRMQDVIDNPLTYAQQQDREESDVAEEEDERDASGD